MRLMGIFFVNFRRSKF